MMTVLSRALSTIITHEGTHGLFWRDIMNKEEKKDKRKEESPKTNFASIFISLRVSRTSSPTCRESHTE